MGLVPGPGPIPRPHPTASLAPTEVEENVSFCLRRIVTYLSSGIVGSYGSSAFFFNVVSICLILLKCIYQIVFQRGCTIPHHSQQYESFSCFASSSALGMVSAHGSFIPSF